MLTTSNEPLLTVEEVGLRIRDVAHQPFLAEFCEYGTAVYLAL
jgi:hypothetical protein